MSLQERILSNVPSSGISPPALYAAMAPSTRASIDAALGGLLRSNRVQRLLGVLQPGPNKAPCEQDSPEKRGGNEIVLGVAPVQTDQLPSEGSGEMNDGKKVERSVDGLREMLFDEIDKLRSGETDAKRAKAIAGLAMTLIKSVEVQITYQQAVAAKKLPATLPEMPLALTTRKAG